MEFVTCSILLSGNRGSTTKNVSYGKIKNLQRKTQRCPLCFCYTRVLLLVRRPTPAQGPAWTGAPERTTESKQSADRWWADTISHALAPLARGAPGICVGKRGELLGRQKNASMHGRLTLFNLTQTTCQADSFHTVRCHRWVGCLQL